MTSPAPRGARPPVKRRPPKTPAELAGEPLADRYLRHIRAAVVFAAAVVIGVADGIRAAGQSACEQELGPGNC